MQLTVPAACLAAAAMTYELPPPLLTAVMAVEGGEVGQWRENSNGSYDMGPMQINSLWVDELAGRLDLSSADVTLRLVYDPCFNVGVAAWILSGHITDTDSYWQGVARYHSRTPELGRAYAERVLEAFRRQQAENSRPPAPGAARRDGGVRDDAMRE